MKETKPRKPPQHPERIPIPSELNSPDFLTAWATWLAARKVTEIGAGRQLKTLAGLGTAKAIEAIDEALRNEWTGIHPKPANGKPAGRPSPTTPPRDFVPGPESEAPTW